jgi:hypothetical protein
LLNGVADGTGVGVGEGDCDGVGVGVGVAVGLGVGVGVGVGGGFTGVHGIGDCELRSFPLKLPGFVAFGAVRVALVALDANAIHRPSALITGRLFAISTLTLDGMAATFVLKRTLFVSVIWKIRRCA